MVTDPYNDSVNSIAAAAALASLLAVEGPVQQSVATVGVARLPTVAAQVAQPSVEPIEAGRAGPQSIAAWVSSGPELNQVNAVSPDPDVDGDIYATGSIYAASQSALYGSQDAAGSWGALQAGPAGEDLGAGRGR